MFERSRVDKNILQKTQSRVSIYFVLKYTLFKKIHTLDTHANHIFLREKCNFYVSFFHKKFTVVVDLVDTFLVVALVVAYSSLVVVHHPSSSYLVEASQAFLVVENYSFAS